MRPRRSPSWASPARRSPPIPSRFTSGSRGTPQQADGIAAKKEIAAYEEAHPGVKIDVQNITYDALHDKLLTALAGGDAPDLSWGLPEWLGELNKMGALRDLTEDAKTWPDESAIYPNVLDALDHRRPSARHAALSRHPRAARS